MRTPDLMRRAVKSRRPEPILHGSVFALECLHFLVLRRIVRDCDLIEAVHGVSIITCVASQS